MTHMTRIYEYLPLTSYELGVRIGLRKMQKKCCRWAGGGGGRQGAGAGRGAAGRRRGRGSPLWPCQATDIIYVTRQFPAQTFERNLYI